MHRFYYIIKHTVCGQLLNNLTNINISTSLPEHSKKYLISPQYGYKMHCCKWCQRENISIHKENQIKKITVNMICIHSGLTIFNFIKYK